MRLSMLQWAFVATIAAASLGVANIASASIIANSWLRFVEANASDGTTPMGNSISESTLPPTAIISHSENVGSLPDIGTSQVISRVTYLGPSGFTVGDATDSLSVDVLHDIVLAANGLGSADGTADLSFDFSLTSPLPYTLATTGGASLVGAGSGPIPNGGGILAVDNYTLSVDISDMVTGTASGGVSASANLLIVPEPGSTGLLAVGLLGLLQLVRRRRG